MGFTGTFILAETYIPVQPKNGFVNLWNCLNIRSNFLFKPFTHFNHKTLGFRQKKGVIQIAVVGKQRFGIVLFEFV